MSPQLPVQRGMTKIRMREGREKGAVLSVERQLLSRYYIGEQLRVTGPGGMIQPPELVTPSPLPTFRKLPCCQRVISRYRILTHIQLLRNTHAPTQRRPALASPAAQPNAAPSFRRAASAIHRRDVLGRVSLQENGTRKELLHFGSDKGPDTRAIVMWLSMIAMTLANRFRNFLTAQLGWGSPRGYAPLQ